jgi:hypothetical protein
MQIRDPAFRATYTFSNLSQFLLRNEHWTGRNVEALHDHFKQSKLMKVKGFGIDPIFREVVTVVVSSFTGQLGNWDADHADEIFKLIKSDDALSAYVCIRFSNGDLEGGGYIQ